MKGKTVVKPPKDNTRTRSGGRRVLHTPSNVVAAIEQHLDQYVGPGADDLVFTGVRGGPLSPSVWMTAWTAARTTHGVLHLTLHDLRHTGLTLAAATGATTAELMHRAGHSSAVAAQRYQHATHDRDKVLADALAALATPVEVLPLNAATDEPPAESANL